MDIMNGVRQQIGLKTSSSSYKDSDLQKKVCLGVLKMKPPRFVGSNNSKILRDFW